MTSSVDAMQTKSILELIYYADIVVQLVIAMLVAASIWSWSIIFNRMIEIRKAQQNLHKFIKLASNYELEDIKKFLKSDDSENFVVFKNIMQVSEVHHQHKSEQDRNIFNQSIILIKDQFLAQLEKGTGVLATISSSATFIGLFGTVWGIMHSFQSIAAAKNTSLMTVAPGIAEALFATAIGLVAAIPALIFYNAINSKIQATENQLNIAIHSLLVKF